MKHVMIFLREKSNAEGLVAEAQLADLLSTWKKYVEEEENPTSVMHHVGYAFKPSQFDVREKSDFLSCYFFTHEILHIRVMPVPEHLKGYTPAQ